MKKGIFIKTVFIFIGVLAILHPFGSNGSAAMTGYPDKAVEVIVPWGPGSNADLLARIVAPHVEKYFKQPFVVVNKTGGAGMMAHNYVALAKPDGYTVLSLNSVYGGLPLTRKPGELQWNFDSYIPVIGYAETNVFFHVKKDAPWKTLKEFVEDSKRNPGKYRYTSNGNYTVSHIITTDLLKQAGGKLTHIPYNTAGDAMTALLGGHVDMTVIFGSAGFMNSGSVKVLAVCAEKRRPDLPDIPTLLEMGYNISTPSVIGFAVPTGTPKEIIEKLYQGTKEVLTANKEEIRKNFIRLEAIPTLLGPEEYLQRCKKDKIYFEEIIPIIKKELGARD